METVAFPKECDIAAKPSLVQTVPLCQIALDPHLCLNGKDGKRWHSEKRVTSQPTPNLVQMVPLCQIALDRHLCLIGYDGNGGIAKRE